MLASAVDSQRISGRLMIASSTGWAHGYQGADYNIVQIVYAASTDDEKLAFYNLYKGALKGALSLVQANEIAAASAQPTAVAGAGAPGAQ